MNTHFSVVLLSEAGHGHEALVPVLQRSCRDFRQLFDIDELVRLSRIKPISALLFGYPSIEQSEVAFFRLLKTDPHIEERIGATLLLCEKTEARQAFQLCRKGLFNDYFISRPLYDPYHLLLRFRQLKTLQAGEGGMATMAPASLDAVCDSLEQIAQADGRVTTINVDMLKRLSETISRAMTSLSHLVESQLAQPGEHHGSASELISQHQHELVHQPIHKDVSEAVNRVQQVMAETAELAIHQRVALGNANPALAPRPKSVVIIEDDPESARNLGKILVDNSCEAVIYRYGSEFARDIDEISADIVMLDLSLPDIPSFHLIDKIRKAPHLSRARLFVMAQGGDKDRVQIAMEMGVDEVILKPIDEQMMAFKLRQY